MHNNHCWGLYMEISAAILKQFAWWSFLYFNHIYSQSSSMLPLRTISDLSVSNYGTVTAHILLNESIIYNLKTLEGLEPTTFELLALLMSRSPMRCLLRHRATHLTSVRLFTKFVQHLCDLMTGRLVNLADFMVSNIWVECGNNLMSVKDLYSLTEITETAKVGQFELRVDWCIKLTLVGREV